MTKAKTVKAYRVSPENVKKNRFPTGFSELMDNVTRVSPIKMRNLGSWKYHVAEDVNGNVFLIEDDVVLLQKLYDRNIGVSEIPYLLDHVGIEQIKAAKESAVQKNETVIESNEEDLDNLPEVEIKDIEVLTVTEVDIENKEVTFVSDKHKTSEDSEGETNE